MQQRRKSQVETGETHIIVPLNTNVALVYKI